MIVNITIETVINFAANVANKFESGQKKSASRSPLPTDTCATIIQNYIKKTTAATTNSNNNVNKIVYLYGLFFLQTYGSKK